MVHNVWMLMSVVKATMSVTMERSVRMDKAIINVNVNLDIPETTIYARVCSDCVCVVIVVVVVVVIVLFV